MRLPFPEESLFFSVLLRLLLTQFPSSNVRTWIVGELDGTTGGSKVCGCIEDSFDERSKTPPEVDKEVGTPLLVFRDGLVVEEV